jgi:hypothetical protein
MNLNKERLWTTRAEGRRQFFGGVRADEALKEALESRGVLNRLKAKVRAEIYKLVDHPSRVSTSFDFVSSGFSFFLSC